MIYLASDFHFWHKNIIKYSNRPFSSVEEMNDDCISFVNKTVKSEDTLVFLGDFMFAKDRYDIWKQWNKIQCNNIVWIFGNHDQPISKDIANDLMDVKFNRRPFIFTGDYYEFKVKGGSFVCAHYPILSWNRQHHGSIMTHGHCHSSINHLNVGVRRIDVGYDSIKKWCISVDEIISIMSKIDAEDIRYTS